MADEPQIVLVRHGETEWSSSGKHTSYSDIPSRIVGASRRPRSPRVFWVAGFALVLTSPRERAIDTCAFAGLGDNAEICEDLAEWNYGDYEGRTTADIRKEVPDWTIFTHGVPGGETDEQVAARADRVLAPCRRRGWQRRALLTRPLLARARRAVDRSRGHRRSSARARRRDDQHPRTRARAACVAAWNSECPLRASLQALAPSIRLGKCRG